MRRPLTTAVILVALLASAAWSAPPPTATTAPATPPRIAVAKDGKGFVTSDDGRPFIPWGFNYDRDWKFRLIEEYWDAEWATVEQDFGEMRALGANVVRVHLQVAQFMDAADKPNEANLARLDKLVRFAETTGLYLDVTGLACYRKRDDPAWYVDLPEADRWAAQARFWDAVAATCADRPGVFCYDLVNEPLVSGDVRKEWVVPVELGGFRYLQFVNRDPAGRERPEVARQWVSRMTRAIRARDPHALVTVGVAPFWGERPEEGAGFVPAVLAGDLDFFCLHVYPEPGKLDAELAMLQRCRAAGKPVVVEETFPLKCDAATFQTFLERSRGVANGWVGFYWGQTSAELKASAEPGDRLTAAWLDTFQAMNPNH